jgi:cell fate (sporulation/competence/biofilm development) regulator YlbF (YheA/YmcA/DUF963 family)
MATEQEILDAARRLGDLVAQHPAIAKYRDAQRAVSQDADASHLLGEFDRQLETLARQEASGMPVTDAQRRTLESLQAQIASQLKVKALSIAQVDYMDLLRKVSQAWQRPIAEAGGVPTGAGAGAGGAGAPRMSTGAPRPV